MLLLIIILVEIRIVIGRNGRFGATMTCRRDCLPSGVPAKYWQTQRTNTSKCRKVARFFQPVVAVKNIKLLLMNIMLTGGLMCHFN